MEQSVGAIKCGLCASRLCAMHTLELEAKRLESEVVMLTHDYNTQSHACRELKNASAALVNEINEREVTIKTLNAKNDELEEKLTHLPAATLNESRWANMMVVRAFIVLVVAILAWLFSHASSSNRALCETPLIPPS